MVFRLWFKSIIHMKLILKHHFQLGQTHKLVQLLRLSHQLKKILNLQIDSTLQTLKLFKEHMMFLLIIQERLNASILMVHQMEQFQVLLHLDGTSKLAMTYQLSLEMSQLQAASAGTLLIDMDGLKTAKKDSILIHNTTGLSTTLVEGIQEQILKTHRTLFSQMVTLIHGVVVVFLQT